MRSKEDDTTGDAHAGCASMCGATFKHFVQGTLIQDIKYAKVFVFGVSAHLCVLGPLVGASYAHVSAETPS